MPAPWPLFLAGPAPTGERRPPAPTQWPARLQESALDAGPGSVGSCTAYWNGDTTQPISASSLGADIAAVQARGGNVIPSFGGYSADTTGTELADSRTSVPAIARVFERLITTYHVPRIDLDVEAGSLTDTAGINRRNEAIAQTEAWAAAHHRSIQFSYTLPTFATGLTPAGLAVPQNAVADGARVSVVNIMTFDYYYGTAQEMATDTETAAAGLAGQLQSLYPGASPARLWHMVGVTEMPPRTPLTSGPPAPAGRGPSGAGVRRGSMGEAPLTRGGRADGGHRCQRTTGRSATRTSPGTAGTPPCWTCSGTCTASAPTSSSS